MLTPHYLSPCICYDIDNTVTERAALALPSTFKLDHPEQVTTPLKCKGHPPSPTGNDLNATHPKV